MGDRLQIMSSWHSGAFLAFTTRSATSRYALPYPSLDLEPLAFLIGTNMALILINHRKNQGLASTTSNPFQEMRKYSFSISFIYMNFGEL
jgi:hypothetical protein